MATDEGPSIQELEVMAKQFEQEAVQAMPSIAPGAELWRKLGMAAAARLAILEKDPANEDALCRLYEYASVHSFQPPKLAKVMESVMAYWETLLRKNPEDSKAHLRMAIATNILVGMNGYPGRRHLKSALAFSPQDAEVCIEMGNCLCFSHSMCRLSKWIKRRLAKRWYEKARLLDPMNARACCYLAGYATKTPHVVGQLIGEALRSNPEYWPALLLVRAVREKTEN